MLNPGTQIGPYRIDALLGRGGMASVYKVWHNGLQRHHAMKVLPPEMAVDPRVVERFLKEARTTASFSHPHIAAIYTVSEENSTQRFFVMELIEGGDLSDLLHARGRLSLQEAIPILQQIASALDYAHSHGVIHRDIKPANVLLQQTADGSPYVKVVDFGISKAMEEEEGARLTRTGMFVGTPEYMSPEQAGSGATVDYHTDQYSLAIMAYEMLCGRPPFKSEGNTSMMSVIMKHVRDEPVPPAVYNPELPQAANDAILKALAKNPMDRFSSCGEFVSALAKRQIDVMQPTRRIEVQNTAVPPRKSTFSVAAVILALLAFAGVAMVGYGLMQKDGNQSAIPDSSANPIIPQPSNSMDNASTLRPAHIINPIRKTPSSNAPWIGEKYPQTRQRILTFNDIQHWDSSSVHYALNEMYARHGYLFTTAFFRDNFKKFAWYHPVPGRTQEAAERLMSPVEKANLHLFIRRRDSLNVESTPPPPPPPPSEPDSVAMSGELFPQTRTRYLTPADISTWSYAKTRYALNEIYARHGYSFTKNSLKRQFAQFGWYHPIPGMSMNTTENMMSQMERANLKLLAERKNKLPPED